MKAFFPEMFRRRRSKPLSKDADRNVLARLERIEASQLLLRQAIAEEVDRLDGYVIYHTDRLWLRLNANAEPRLCNSSAAVDAILETQEFDVVVPSAESGLLDYISRHGFETSRQMLLR